MNKEELRLLYRLMLFGDQIMDIDTICFDIFCALDGDWDIEGGTRECGESVYAFLRTNSIKPIAMIPEIKLLYMMAFDNKLSTLESLVLFTDAYDFIGYMYPKGYNCNLSFLIKFFNKYRTRHLKHKCKLIQHR
jgi:hypothetical protein